MESIMEPVGAAEQESWFLSQIEQADFHSDALIRLLQKKADDGRPEQAENWADLLQESLLERKQADAGLKLLALRSFWSPATTETRARWKDLAAQILGGRREDGILVENAGFALSDVSVVECIRRLQILLQLKPGIFCYDKTWGFGIVRQVDLFYAKVEIDFDGKPRHMMSLAYAGETLEMIGEDHLLARKQRDPAALQALVADNPAEVVRITLRSFGPLPVPQLMERLVPAILPESDWKRFWDAARRGLKNDPLVEIPAKRTRPVRLLKREKKIDAEWFEALSIERDMETVLRLAEEVTDTPDVMTALGDPERRILGERLAFVVKGAGRRHADLTARALMLAGQLGVGVEWVDVPAMGAVYFTDDIALTVFKKLPAKWVRRFLDFLVGMDEFRSLQRLIDLLPRLEIGPLQETLDLLRQKGKEAECAELFRRAIYSQKAEVEYLCWLIRHIDLIETWNLGPVPQISDLMLMELEKGYNGERLRAKNQLRERFEQKEWLKMTFEALNDAKRREWLMKIKNSEAWPNVDRQSVMGKVIKLHPELQDVLASNMRAETDHASLRGLVTSNRSYKERQAQFEKIVNVDIPKVAKEIGIARSYGDLRENFEFKAAKEMQGVLMARRAELEKMLHEVRPTDFKGLPEDRAGMGTGVVLQYPDGHEERYFILGEWDQDNQLHIISSASRMAKVLEGHHAGDKVSLPSEQGDQECLLSDVLPLSAEVREWIAG